MSNNLTQEQVNQLWLKLALLLIDNGMGMLKKAFHLTPVKLTGQEITETIKKYLPNSTVVHLDNWYLTIPIEQWKEIIKADWTDTKKWTEEVFDCDNFSNYFSANMAMFYELNSVGRVYGKFYKGTQEFINYHYWNVIITPDKKIWFFEPQNDKLTEADYKGGMLLIGGNKYEPMTFYFG